MKSTKLAGSIATAALVAGAQAKSLADVCTVSHVQSSLPLDAFTGLEIKTSSVTASPVYNVSVSDQTFYPDGTFDYCNVTFAYSHAGRDDSILLGIWLPAPDAYQNRWLSTGGGGFAINLEGDLMPAGLLYGAAAGITDGGFGAFTTDLDAVFPSANGTINWDAIYNFGYQSHHELSVIGKAFTKNFFNTTASSSKLYSYYMGCSEGGREGWSQVQRFPEEWDGAIIGAPAIRYGQQQVNHLFPNVVEQTLGYYPPPCELEKIMNLTIAACDELDGRKDGVVSRTDLCQLHFNLNSTIGKPYYCAAETTSENLKKRSAHAKRLTVSNITPAQNGTVSAKGAEAAATMLKGLHTLDGKRAYIWFQITSAFSDAETQYNSDTGSYELDIDALSGEWVARFLELVEADNLSSLDNVTYDTLRDWMELGWRRYGDSLQTTYPDLSAFKDAGGKIIHYHGESDPSIPTGSSVHYHESVRKIMYPDLTYNQSTDALASFYRLYLVPGASHCATNAYEPGPWPQDNMAVMIDWVEKGVVPVTLNATYLSGEEKGSNAQICAWPLRPLWKNNGTVMECVYDQASIDTWQYDFNAYSLPLY
ncbi:hypothetical protein CBS63078_576 [Aspergillus niger]|uniref:Carboxylic ester hydrolase n=5 Tax=Aspergillus TaxID=5052 RepID=A5ABC3_ASPNC|nr:uncharacterized protein An08g09800 [Aspergillus niger]EHA18444.1 hypothetical protein ASPNIDRAFT_175881 [Aspergillus niger ATCC 1015]RDH18476.1 tannase and feruloyl esterase [Aspergillus niger ATCC 13496]RDK47548.1 tannase and feruloyl esterase [Aspergillus phoenicis ATCC 13157]KAI2822486.1 hypothetical protein CBS115989_2197 [Aspergillus niger]KAI2831868.1 hypothetical protein CBS133816_2118 [Aspergillus niger]|eukprot:XP_001393089.1 tannase subunit [Aspergillus niger CBS 513.88]